MGLGVGELHKETDYTQPLEVICGLSFTGGNTSLHLQTDSALKQRNAATEVRSLDWNKPDCVAVREHVCNSALLCNRSAPVRKAGKGK